MGVGMGVLSLRQEVDKLAKLLNFSRLFYQTFALIYSVNLLGWKYNFFLGFTKLPGLLLITEKI